jgi:hypothetical protein
VIALGAGSAHAEVRPGLRIGGAFSGPDAIFFGGSLAIHAIPAVPNLRLEPSLDLGFGGGRDRLNFFMLRGNGHIKYMFPVTGQVTLFPLIGLEVLYLRFERPGGSSTTVGLDIGGGVELGPVGLELYFGVGDVFDLNLALTYTF